MRPQLFVPFVLLTATLSGCLADPGPDSDSPPDSTSRFNPEWASLVFQAETGHDHRNHEHHLGRSTPNFHVIAHEPLITDYYGKTSAGHLCGDVAEKAGKRLAVVHSWVSDVSAIIIDVTDSSKPQKVGELVLPNTHVYDLGISPDQRWVLLATTSAGMGPNPDLRSAPAYYRDACTGQTTPLAGPEDQIPYQSGVVLVDIANPRAPKVADYLFLGGGHSMQVKELKGRTYALVTTATFSLLEVANGKLVPLAILTGCSSVTTTCGYHDGYLQTHPITKQNLVYLAGGSALDVFNIDNPAQPRHVGKWNTWSDIGPQISPTFLHAALPMYELWDGKHYTFLEEECGGRPGKTPSCLVVALDTTDIAKPKYVSAWTVPAETGAWSGLLYSLHYIAVQNGTLFVTNYHGGVWAVDVSTPEALRALPTIGVFLPTTPSPKPLGVRTSYDYAPAVLDVNPLSDGTLLVYDHTSGVYTVRFDRSDPAPSPKPWWFG